MTIANKTLLEMALLSCIVAPAALAHDARGDNAPDPTRAGYVLKSGDGEALGPNRIIKASPKSGARGAVLVLDRLPIGYTTGLHIHTKGDEFFYIIAGAGVASLGDEHVSVGPADVVFVPEGVAHAITVKGAAEMEIMGFMDAPGLAALFREVHAHVLKTRDFDLDDCNAFGAKHNMICITMGGMSSP